MHADRVFASAEHVLLIIIELQMELLARLIRIVSMTLIVIVQLEEHALCAVVLARRKNHMEGNGKAAKNNQHMFNPRQHLIKWFSS